MAEGKDKKYVDDYPIRNVDNEMYLGKVIKIALNSFDDKKNFTNIESVPWELQKKLYL